MLGPIAGILGRLSRWPLCAVAAVFAFFMSWSDWLVSLIESALHQDVKFKQQTLVIHASSTPSRKPSRRKNPSKARTRFSTLLQAWDNEWCCDVANVLHKQEFPGQSPGNGGVTSAPLLDNQETFDLQFCHKVPKVPRLVYVCFLHNACMPMCVCFFLDCTRAQRSGVEMECLVRACS